MAKLTTKNNIKIRLMLVTVITVTIFFYDISSRKTGAIAKISNIKEYEVIETPGFLKGLYVSKTEKKIYEEIDQLVNKYSNYNLINLTNSGLFSLYKKNNNEFHKMYVDWGMVNSYLYPDYIPKLSRQIQLKSNVIFSAESLTIEGYVPIKVFPILNNIWEIAQQTIILVPGTFSNKFDVVATYNKKSVAIKLKLAAPNKHVTINSIVVKTFTETDIPKKIQRNEFEYNIMPRILNSDDRVFLNDLYSFDEQTGQYFLKKISDKRTISKMMGILSNIFLYEKLFHISDTFKNSRNERIDVYVDNHCSNYADSDLLDLNISEKNSILLISNIKTSEMNILKLRINYDENSYHEEIIRDRGMIKSSRLVGRPCCSSFPSVSASSLSEKSYREGVAQQ